MITDLTEGNVNKKLWLFSIPMLFSVMFQQLYNIADSMIAGKFAGEKALAAVGASYPITMLFIAVAIGCNIGGSVVISQLFGAKDYRNMKTAISTIFISSLFLSVVLTLLGLIFCDPLMRLIKTPDDIFYDAGVYLKIYIGGLTFLFLYNICTGVFNALGNSKIPLNLLIISSIGNVVLGILFVRNLHMGVAGLAWSTFLAQGFSSIVSIILLIVKLRTIQTKEPSPRFSLLMLKKISRIAIPSILQQSFISVGNIFIQGLINGFGSSVIAGYSAAVKLNTFTITSFTTLANGLSSFTAQNIGAKKPERIKKGFQSGMLLTFLVALPFFVGFFFFGEQFLHLFMNSDSSIAITTGKEFLMIVSPFYFLISTKLMADGVLRGSGSMGYFMTATFTDLLLRVGLAFILSVPYGTTGIWVSWPIGWIIATVLSVSFYLKGVWKKSIL